jgi:hypothetical protein
MRALKIAPQGRFDGACFAYSVVNTHKALVAPSRTLNAFNRLYGIEAKWRQLINILPVTNSLLNGDGIETGLTLKHDSDFTHQLLHHAFLIFGGNKHSFQINRLTLTQFRAKQDYQNSVVVLCTRHPSPKGDHYLCVVGFDGEHAYLACSWALYETGKYQEQTIDGTNRIYNSFLRRQNLSKKQVYDTHIFEILLNVDGLQEPEP